MSKMGNGTISRNERRADIRWPINDRLIPRASAAKHRREGRDDACRAGRKKNVETHTVAKVNR